MIMIALGCDHGGFILKEAIRSVIEATGNECKDFGCFSEASVDYPVIAQNVGRAVASGECEKGILICGTGVGMSIAANKIHGVRCVVCSDCFSAKLSRMHNDTNVLSLGARVLGPELAKMITELWLTTPFEGERHARRVGMINKLDNGETL